MPAENYNVLSGDTRNNQEYVTKSYNALLAPGAKMNNKRRRQLCLFACCCFCFVFCLFPVLQVLWDFLKSSTRIRPR